jgi:guanosine-3',5'-bis(diphosphate) 3'-pyrophosphohydrolase
LTDDRVEAAHAFAQEVYASRLRRSGRTIEHPAAVAQLLAADGQPPSVVVAGLLHDVLEDTDVDVDELSDRFGPHVAHVVAALTQDESLESYKARKRDLRHRTVDAGSEAATIALADKLAKVQCKTQRPKRRKLKHYRETLHAVEARYGPTELSSRLREQLSRWPDE